MIIMVKQAAMEQQPRKTNISSNNCNNNKEDKDRYLGVAVHSQVKKIKQEMEKFKFPALQQPEMRPILKEITLSRQQRSRSPLGLAEKRPIPVGN
ncbi:hypothetical protein ACH5RR_029885 [Cinchona calisaya]|uniref:Uncharacterized protein n=1 Tax=Cinchona calisaya TaxID=153742 RepID=A0ABD2YUF3_9GENT